jgi:UDP-apiose/xylose synthase
MNILNLGAGGFIGAHLTERLLAEGCRVTGVDTHADKVAEFMADPRFRFCGKDIREPGFDLDGLIRQADVVVNLIAYANPGLYVKVPLEVFQVNFLQNMRIVDACVKFRKRLIQFSSCEVYGKTVASFLADDLSDPDNGKYAIFSEDASNFILGPVNKHRWIYACAKQMLERVIHAYGLDDRLDYAIIRPFNFIGPKIDYLPSQSDGVPRVFSFFMDALLNRQPLKLVDGGDHRRCYTYIADAIECLWRIIENRDENCHRQIFNIGSPGNEISIRGLAERMSAIFAARYLKPGAVPSPIVSVSGEEFYGYGYEDSDRRIPDISKARKLLRWEPKFGLDEMLELSMRHYVLDSGASAAMK